ncbi:cytoplasmic tRNA 2-thiolation protein 2 [Phlebotomus argentipes]|uniref:cytoplasmic tRNA 2-thiolation protein 2 n=1 Tax=Phlebotomus argentipes TaxID=94469 RepID=UPI002892AA62|nr:cytoplasmic tRNA 2-thiolation protein 2 [Phlebotomus argentipes]
MCSIGEDDFGDEGGAHSMPVTEKETPADLGTCKKCGSPAVVKLIFKEAQCKDCFLYYIRHKFRANLGSTKILPRNCKVLTVFDGSAGSVCLLDLVITSLRMDNHKRLNMDHCVVFLDDSFLTKRKESINKVVQQFQEEFYYISLADDSNTPKKWEAEVEVSNDEAFLKMRMNFSSQTAWEDFLEQRRKNLIRKVAKKLNCSHVFLPDITIDLASSLLSNISLGRGSSVALDVGFIDDRDPEVTLLRPIRDLTMKEVENHIRVRQLKCLQAAASDSQGSIQSLTEKFVLNLQENFSATVSTVFRTGDKLAPKNFSDGNCVLCQSNLDWKGSRTLSAVEFSSTVSTGEEVAPRDEQYCFACQKIISDCPGISQYIIK